MGDPKAPSIGLTAAVVSKDVKGLVGHKPAESEAAA